MKSYEFYEPGVTESEYDETQEEMNSRKSLPGNSIGSRFSIPALMLYLVLLIGVTPKLSVWELVLVIIVGTVAFTLIFYRK